MRWSRIASVVLGSSWFFLVSCTAGLVVGTQVVSHLDARDVSKGDTLHTKFSIVVPSSNDERPFYVFSLYDLERYEESRGDSDEPFTETYLMPQPGGSMDDGSSHFSYEVIEQKEHSQVIEVMEAYHDGDNTIWSRYEATRSGFTPISSRMFYFGYMFTAFPYAIGFAVLVYAVGRYLRHRDRESSRSRERQSCP